MWSPQLSFKHDQIKMNDHVDRWVTPPKWVTSPIWVPPPTDPRRKGVLQAVFFWTYFKVSRSWMEHCALIVLNGVFDKSFPIDHLLLKKLKVNIC